jgi:hypothetical protein
VCCRVFLIGRISIALATVLVIFGGGRAAKGADSEEAETLIRQGLELRQQNRDERALPFFQKAYDLVQTPRTAGQLGFAEMAVGYWLDAEQHLSTALESPDHPWVAKNLTTLKQALARIRTNIGEIVVDGPPPGATIAVNRHPAGTFPLPSPIRVAKGKVDIEVSASGYLTATRSLHITGSERQQVTVSLEKAANQSAPPKSPPEPSELAPAPRAQASISIAPPVSPPGTTGASVSQKIGWGLGIGGATTLVGAVVETVIWQQRRSRFNSASGCYEDQPSRGSAGCSSLYDSTHTAMTLSIVGYVAAGVLAGGSAALVLTSKSSESGSSAIAIGCAPAFNAWSMTCRLTF